MKSFQLLTAYFLAAAAVLCPGCSDKTPSGPVLGLGNITISKYVAIGDSYAAGYQSNALYASGQRYSYPALIAQQVKAAGAGIGSFEQPIYSDPGNADPVTGFAARYEIISLVGPVIGPAGLQPGSPSNLGLARPYDNLGVPGAVVFDLLDTTSVLIKAGPPRDNPFFQLVLRNQQAFGARILDQARALNPDLVTFWLGGNDVLGFATSGGFSPSAPTPSGVFTFLYAQAMDSLRAALPNAKIVVGNIADITAMPFFTTAGPRIAANLPPGLYLRYQKHGNAGPSLDSTRFTESTPPMITLKGSAYASLLGRVGGQGAGKWYQDNGYPGLPPGIDTTMPFGFHPLNPWPDALVLDADEQATVASAVGAYNTTISTLAASHGALVVDFKTFLDGVRRNGYFTGGQEFTVAYVSGGIFSLDGVHPSSRGYAIIANQFIKVMNEQLGTGIPFVDVSTIPGIPAPIGKIAEGPGMPVIPFDAFRDFDWLWGGRH